MPEKQQSLAPGSLTGDRFVIRELLGAGGFGMSYRGRDTQLACEVVIKEYLPGSARRVPTETLQCTSTACVPRNTATG